MSGSARSHTRMRQSEHGEKLLERRGWGLRDAEAARILAALDRAARRQPGGDTEIPPDSALDRRLPASGWVPPVPTAPPPPPEAPEGPQDSPEARIAAALLEDMPRFRVVAPDGTVTEAQTYRAARLAQIACGGRLEPVR